MEGEPGAMKEGSPGPLPALLLALGYAAAITVYLAVGPVPDSATGDPAEAAPVLRAQAPLLASAGLAWGTGFLLALDWARRAGDRLLTTAGFLGGLGGLTLAPGIYLLARGLARYMEEAATRQLVDEETVLSLTLPGVAVLLGTLGLLAATALLAAHAWNQYKANRNPLAAAATILLATSILAGLAQGAPLTGDPKTALLGLAATLALAGAWARPSPRVVEKH